MKIPKTVAAFKKWARNPRLNTGQIQNIGACVAFNECKRDSIAGVCRVLAVVAEECAIRWDKAWDKAASS